MRRQPHPDVTSIDVERIVRRDFPSGQFDAVMAALKQYGVQRWERECARVQLAALKLANGRLDRLQMVVELAKKDYRDVLTPAEYPEYGRRMASAHGQENPERDQVIDRDWDQYRAWLEKP